jgi:hypothetical protein
MDQIAASLRGEYTGLSSVTGRDVARAMFAEGIFKARGEAIDLRARYAGAFNSFAIALRARLTEILGDPGRLDSTLICGGGAQVLGFELAAEMGRGTLPT